MIRTQSIIREKILLDFQGMLLINGMRNIANKLFTLVWTIERVFACGSLLIFVCMGPDWVTSSPILSFIIFFVDTHVQLAMYFDVGGCPCLSPRNDNYQSFTFFAILIWCIYILLI